MQADKGRSTAVRARLRAPACERGRLRARARRERKLTRARAQVFIHVPPADVQPLEETLAAVRAAIAVVCAEVEGLVSACGRYSPLHGPGSPSALVTNLVHRERALRAQTP